MMAKQQKKYLALQLKAIIKNHTDQQEKQVAKYNFFFEEYLNAFFQFTRAKSYLKSSNAINKTKKLKQI